MSSWVVPVVVSAVALVGLPASGAEAASNHTGFTQPFLGARRYVAQAPRQITGPQDLHQAIGMKTADAIAANIGLTRQDAFSARQFREFISGGGVGGSKKAARILDRSVKIFINTVGHPLYADVNGVRTKTVLGSYGLFVNHRGLLESLANDSAPTRKANAYIEPTKYLSQWCHHNHATDSLNALYRSAFTVDAAYGFKAQDISEPAELVRNTQGGVVSHVGMSMVPTIWIVNFALLYVLKPSLAAAMPSAWAPIPPTIVRALNASPHGRVHYSRYASLLS